MADERAALIRGINVGKAKRIAMSELRTVVEQAGFTHVRTLLNSGNVAFTVPGGVRKDPARAIEQGIASRIGVSARVVVVTAAELGQIVAENKLAEVSTNDSRLMVTLLIDHSRDDELRAIARNDWGDEAFHLGAHAAYSWCPRGILESPLMTAVTKLLRDGATTRNWTTICRLSALVKS